MDRSEIKKRLHCARVNLTYRKKHATEEIIAATQAEVDRLTELYADSDPARCTLRVRSPYFIGPKRERGIRGDGPTIICFRCREEKSVEEYYDKGTVCIECIVKRSAEWADKNPEKSQAAKDKWIEENREHKNATTRAQYHKNHPKERARSRTYYENNHDKCIISSRECAKRRRKSDPQYRALMTCKRRMWILFKSAGVKKTLRSAELLGIDRAGLFKHLESIFLPGMTWNNRGRDKGCWHIDHRIPCARFDMTDPEQAKACWHYTNLQPMWAEDNWRKGDKIIVDGVRKEQISAIATVEQSTALVA